MTEYLNFLRLSAIALIKHREKVYKCFEAIENVCVIMNVPITVRVIISAHWFKIAYEIIGKIASRNCDVEQQKLGRLLCIL